MKLIKGYHITPTEIKHILYLIENNMTQGGTKLKQYKINKLSNGQIEVDIASKYTATIGEQSKWHRSKVTITI